MTGRLTIAITGVTQDEPVNGLGDGDTGPDAVISGDTVFLRAERSEKGDGRVYSVIFEATNPAGTCTKTVPVKVPRDMGRGVAIDDGQVFDSTKP